MSKQCVLSPYAIKTPAAPEISPESCILYPHKGLEKRTLHRYVAPTKGIVVGQKDCFGHHLLSASSAKKRSPLAVTLPVTRSCGQGFCTDRI